ncbi:Ig-like domain-containing protein, partial [Klebsiella quasipneumoniae]|uniref:Ig-like domain-containing protein n=1 Tax=Klebsiella quasipneumoniae TaxID=1463165 RepID=UPI00272FCE5E
PQIEFTIWGEQAKAYEKKMEEGLFILLPDTVIEDGTPEATSVTLNKTTTSIKVGANETLTATVAPSGASQVVTWSSSDDT